jgi:anti-anti-sigma factor
MQWSARVANGCTVLTISGSINKADASRLKLLLGSPTSLVVDMREITFLGPAGLDVLADAAAKLADHPWPLAIAIGDDHAQVLRAIQDANLQQTLRLFDTVEHALAAGPIHGE